MAPTSKDIVEFVCVCSRNMPADTRPKILLPQLVEQLLRLAKRVQRYNLLHATVGLSAQQERVSDRLEAEFLVLCTTVGWGGKTGGDPRGYALKILFPDHSTNSWGGADDGWGVPQ